MGIHIISWQEADRKQLRELYENFPYPPYFGSPIVDERLQSYRFENIRRAAEASPETHFVAIDKRGRALCAAQLRRTPHLSDHFGIEVASIADEAFLCGDEGSSMPGFLLLIRHLRTLAEEKGVRFVTAAAASQAHRWIRALEEAGFRYADGFRHAVEDISDDYDEFLVDKLLVRDFVPSDYDEILYSFEHMPFPSYLLYEPEFDKQAVVRLYANRYREVHEKGLGRVFVGEMGGKFMGALNAIIDNDILREVGVVVNHVSQGLIVHPRAKGRGIAIGLVAFRHRWYREQGMKYGYLGSNINNIAMIRGLERIKAKHAGIEISFTLRAGVR